MEEIHGIEKEILDTYIALLNKNKPRVDNAVDFLHSVTKGQALENHISTIEELEVLRHLETFVENKRLPLNGKKRALLNIKSHFRKAILRCYQHSALYRADEAIGIYEKNLDFLPDAMKEDNKAKINFGLTQMEHINEVVTDLEFAEEKIAIENPELLDSLYENILNDEWNTYVKNYSDICDHFYEITSELKYYIKNIASTDDLSPEFYDPYFPDH